MEPSGANLKRRSEMSEQGPNPPSHRSIRARVLRRSLSTPIENARLLGMTPIGRTVRCTEFGLPTASFMSLLVLVRGQTTEGRAEGGCRCKAPAWTTQKQRRQSLRQASPRSIALLVTGLAVDRAAPAATRPVRHSAQREVESGLPVLFWAPIASHPIVSLRDFCSTSRIRRRSAEGADCAQEI